MAPRKRQARGKPEAAETAREPYHQECLEVGSSRIRLIQGDCLAGMDSLLEESSVDVVITSPPYNLGINYSRYDDTIDRPEYLSWLGRWARKVKRVLQPAGSLFLNLGAKPSDPWVPFDVAQVMRNSFVLQNTIHWIKSIAIEKRDVGNYGAITGNVTVGHYKPINSERFLNDCHEYLFHFTKTGRVPLDRLAIGVEYQDKSNVTRWKKAGSDRHCRGNTWFVPYQTILRRDRDRPHPATFPVELARKAILLHGRSRVRTVLDPFLGLGHTARAAVACGVDFIGFEIDADYFADARDNLSPDPQLTMDAKFKKGGD